MVDFVRKLHDRQALEKRESRRRFLAGEGFVAWPGPALRKFVDDQFVSYPILRMAPSGRTELGRILGLPTSFLVSPEGEVVAVQVGPVTAEALEAFITSHGASEAHEESSR